MTDTATIVNFMTYQFITYMYNSSQVEGAKIVPSQFCRTQERKRYVLNNNMCKNYVQLMYVFIMIFGIDCAMSG